MIDGFWTGVFAAYQSIFAPVLCALKRWFCWSMEWVWEWIEPFSTDLLDAWPSTPNPDWVMALKFWTLADTWVPLTECLQMLTGYLAVSAILIGIRMVLKVLPFFG